MKLVNVCYPAVCKGFKLFPYWLNCVTWKKGEGKIYRWLFWNWSFIEQTKCEICVKNIRKR